VTARIYTDLSYFTSDPIIGRDAARVFNYITGYAEPSDIEKMAISPLTLRKRIIEHIQGEAGYAPPWQAGGDLDEDEFAGRSRYHRCAVRGLDGRRIGGSRGARYLLSAARDSRIIGKHSRQIDHRAFSRARPNLLLRHGTWSAQRKKRLCISRPPT